MAKKKVEEMTAEQVATGTLENEVAEGANEKATAVEYNIEKCSSPIGDGNKSAVYITYAY